ncbi:shikimate kinase [Salinibacter sp. 10B]|uniref:shikimate kinase n=1 Tax=Salinibacter sp. 10B TaxID=1923971 RepID=UPI000CF4B73E|nr:shikimate kinase [Salinibacter sp. 10B]PQJ35978.1 shikimate kinase [Salinibacter sp. 10B]
MRLYLNGFMASGKSTVGPRVAARLGMTFLDLDRLITAHAGRSIPDIFAEDGEEHFRHLERTALRQTAETDELVVALGGGALIDEENRAFAKAHGRVVYLKVDPETVLERVADEADQRPLLQDDDGEALSGSNMRARIEQMLFDRRSAYEDAHHTVDAARSVDAVVSRLQQIGKAHGEGTTSGA